jgi:HEAT repeat protein
VSASSGDQSLPQIVIDAGDDIDRLKIIVRSAKVEERNGAAWVLGQTGKYEAISPLIGALRDSDASVRATAARALGMIKDLPDVNRKIDPFEDTPADIRARDQLKRALTDREPIVRAAAAAALVNYGWVEKMPESAKPAAKPPTVKPAHEPLLPLMNAGFIPKDEPFSGVQERAPLTRNKPIPQPVLDAGYDLEQQKENLRNKLFEVREAATWALGQIGGLEVVGSLINSLKDPDHRVRETAARALGQIHYKREDLIRGDRFADSSEMMKAKDQLLKTLKDKELNVRSAAAASLGHFGSQDVATALVALMAEEDPGVRSSAAIGLGECNIASGEVVLGLIKLLKDTDFWARTCAARSLGKLHDTRAVGPITALLKDTNSSVRASAARALGELAEFGEGHPADWEEVYSELQIPSSEDRSEEVQAFAQTTIQLVKNRMAAGR